MKFPDSQVRKEAVAMPHWISGATLVNAAFGKFHIYNSTPLPYTTCRKTNIYVLAASTCRKEFKIRSNSRVTFPEP